jgi:hypothetical protein
MIQPDEYINHIRNVIGMISSRVHLKQNIDKLVESEYKWYIDILRILLDISTKILESFNNNEYYDIYFNHLYLVTKSFYKYNDKYIKIMKLNHRYSRCNFRDPNLRKHVSHLLHQNSNNIRYILSNKIIFNVSKYDIQDYIKKLILLITLSKTIK